MPRVTGLSVLLCTCMAVGTVPAQAGFTFTPPPAAPPQLSSAPATATPPGDAPMPIVPNAPVTSETLPPVDVDPMAMSPMPAVSATPQQQAAAPMGAMPMQDDRPMPNQIMKSPAPYSMAQPTSMAPLPSMQPPRPPSAAMQASNISCGETAGQPSMTQSPAQDKVLAQPVRYQPAQAMQPPMMQPQAASPVPASNTQPVYIRRQRETSVIKAPQNEPMDTEALLQATQNGDSIALTQDTMDSMQVRQDGQQLMINPYPLEQQAVHGGDMGTLPVQQAMMEEAGSLRPVAVPGGNVQGARMRAKITSRYDSGEQYKDRTAAAPIQAAAPSQFSAGSLTPIPGGEGQPLNSVESAPLPPMQISRREEQPAPAAPLVASRTSVMPRPATPESYPVAAVQQPSMRQVQNGSVQQMGAGHYSDAVGFGRDLPLALALSQVVPPEYSYVFARDVNVGSTVSWQGGKPWNQVMDEMLASSGMRAVIQDNQIMVLKANT